MTSIYGGNYRGYTGRCSAPNTSIAAPIGISMPLMQPPRLQQPVMQQPATMMQQPMMQQPIAMMQQPMPTFTFKFSPSAALDTHVHREEANPKQPEADALPASNPSPKNFTPRLNSNTEIKGRELPVFVETLDGLKTNVDVSSTDDCTEVTAEPQLEMPEPNDADTTCKSVIGTQVDSPPSTPRPRPSLPRSLSPQPLLPDGFMDRFDDNSGADCVGVVAETQVKMLELVDADKKCNSVVGANGDYRSGMARQAVACLLNNRIAANQADANKIMLQNSVSHSMDNSTAASTAVTSRATSACPSHRSQKQEELTQSYATPAPPTAVEKHNSDEWAKDHFESLENNTQCLDVRSAIYIVGEAVTATADDEHCSSASPVICPPVASPLPFPTSDSQEGCAPIVIEATPLESARSDCNHSDAYSKVESNQACEEATCVEIGNSEDVCSQGHDLRWHAWRCAICDKRGYGLRFGCVECCEANLCAACRKIQEAQNEVVSQSPSSLVHEEAKDDVAKVGCEARLADGTNVIVEDEVASALEPAYENGNSTRREKPVHSASKSVLSVQPKESSSAARLLKGLTQQQGSKRRSSSRIQAGDSKSEVAAEGSKQRRSGMGQRAGASVLSVKHTSSSAAAGILGPLLEQKTKC